VQRKESGMGVNWIKKRSVTLRWLVAGPAFLLYLIFIQHMKVFENGVAEGLLLSVIFILMPAVAVFAIYWPTTPTTKAPSGEDPND
jgi:hypothetical protein